MTFFIPTANFNQDFTAITDAFTNALILPDEFHNQLEVLFFGVGGSGPGGSAFVPADISAPPGSPPDLYLRRFRHRSDFLFQYHTPAPGFRDFRSAKRACSH